MVTFEQPGDIIQIRKLEREKLQCNEKVNKTEKKKKVPILCIKQRQGKGALSTKKAQRLKHDQN